MIFLIKIIENINFEILRLLFNLLHNLFNLLFNLLHNLLFNLLFNLLSNLLFNYLFNLLYNLLFNLFLIEENFLAYTVAVRTHESRIIKSLLKRTRPIEKFFCHYSRELLGCNLWSWRIVEYKGSLHVFSSKIEEFIYDSQRANFPFHPIY